MTALGDSVQSTHHLTRDGDRVVKRFRSWDNGEPEREWAGLTLMQRHAPGLAPEPLERRTEGEIPVVVMSLLPGEPLGSAPLTPAQLGGVAEALTRLHTSVPHDELACLAERQWGPAALGAAVSDWVQQPHPPVEGRVESAIAAARGWAVSAEASGLAGGPAELVFAHADGNLGNLLWDGARCRVVDFEDCGVSDPAYEVADLVEHVSVSLPGLVDVDALSALLDFSSDQRERLLRYRRLLAVFWLLMLLPGNRGHARNPEGSHLRQAERVLGLL